jgi:cation:H+ antiporter
VRVARLVSGTSVLPKAQAADIYMAGLGILLTTVYIFGLIFRPQRRILRMGPDSMTVLALYAIGIVGLIVVAGR